MNAAAEVMDNMKRSCLIYVREALKENNSIILEHVKEVYGYGIYKLAVLEVLKENMSAIKTEMDKPYDPYDERELSYHSYNEGRLAAYGEILTILEKC